ncbi:MAG: Ig-like domain-containing protein [Bacteroidales bacterium]|nr:Ig-like domain-containing protein [Bacteroidales bacterium]
MTKNFFRHSVWSFLAMVGMTQSAMAFTDFKVQLTAAPFSENTSTTSFAVSVDSETGAANIVEASAENVNFSFTSARWNDSDHGWVNCVFTVPVDGPVKVGLGNCKYGSQNGTIVDAGGSSTDLKVGNANCWHENKEDNITYSYYAGTSATTLTITYNGYCPYISVEAINASDIPSTATLTFDASAAEAQGVAPALQEVNVGTEVTIGANTSLYKEGYTLTAWTDGTNSYTAGQSITVNENVTLTPVFTANAVSFADRTAELTATWDFQQKNGAVSLQLQNKSGLVVTQIAIGDATIDFPLTIDATSGKYNNASWQDWAQVNDGTVFSLPAVRGAVYTTYSMSDNSATTFNGDAGTFANYENTYTYEGSAAEMQIVIGGGSYYRWVKAVYPVAAAESTWKDIKADFTNGAFLTAEEASSAVTAGLKMNDDGSYTRVAADDASANAIITAKYHSDDHGLCNFSATVAVEGTVKISFGTCAWGGDVTVKNADGETVATFNTNNGTCYHSDKEANIVSAYYKQDKATTLTISGGSYVPYFAVEAVDPSAVPSDVKFIYDITSAEAEGVAPASETVSIGKQYTLPKNFTLYKEGYTLTGWTDGTNTYATGETITAPDAESVTLTPVFTANEVSLADRTEEVSLLYTFRRDAGAPTVAYQNATGIWVAQATIGDKTIDVKATFDTNNGGKFANGNWNDWAQLNGGTKWTIPSCKGATITIEAYNELTTTSIDGQTDYTSGKTISYEIANSAETVDVVIGNDGSYYRYIKVTLPVVQSQGGASYDNVAATVAWPFNDMNSVSAYTTDPSGIFSTVAVNTGDLEITGVASRSADSNADGISFIKFKPSGSTTALEWAMKPKSGLTFTPTKVSMWIQRFGTDAENGVTITAKAGEGESVTLGNFTAPRANKTQADDKFGSSSNYANYVEISLTADQQAALASGDGLSIFATIGVGSTKEGGFSQVTVEGIVNGTVADIESYTLATVVAPEGAGSINVYPKVDEYEDGSEVTLTATENFGYDFVNWTNAAGDEVSADAKFKYTITANETLTANFVAVNTYALNLVVDGTNDYMVTVSPEPTVVDGKWMYEEGTGVQLTANSYEGLVTFTNWSDGETNSNKTISMTADVDLTAFYAQADIIVGWDFYKTGSNGRKADFAAQDNDADALNLVNTSTGETQGWLDKSTLGGGGYESFAGAAVNWRTGASNGDVGNWHWQTKINAEAFRDINVQFQMLYNYNAYQTYLAEWSLDGSEWTSFGSVTMNGTRVVGKFSEMLPEACNNQASLYIRMRADKENSSVDGTASANDGNTLAMFFITGTAQLVNDGVAPAIVSTVPANGATGASATGKIVLTFDERVKVADGVKGDLSGIELTPSVSGKVVTFEYKGLEYTKDYTFTLAANSIADLTDNFLAEPISLTFTTMTRPTIEKKAYDAIVENVDQLMAAIAAADSRSDKTVRFRIFVKNGEYTIPLSSTIKTVNGYEVPECITFLNSSNVSFIGESRDGVIITNGIDKNETFAGNYGLTSKYDGIGNSDVFQIGSKVSGLYWQDLTVETGMDDATGRDLAIQDKGTQNVYKNVGLRGYQDTWTSNNDNGLYYFEGGYVRGRTDYMCGKGDIFWNGVELRQIAGGYAAVPSKPKQYGWIYKDCVINGEASVVEAATGKTASAESVDGNYTLGRPWGSGTPIALFIDTKMNVVPSAIGWNEMSGGYPKRFAEYNSMTSTGSVIDLSGRKTTFADTHENNPVLTAEEALAASNLHTMYGDWDPTLLTEQAPLVQNVVLNGTALTWDNSEYALLYAIVKNGAVIDFTLENSYTVDDATATYAVRAANEMGGLNEAVEATSADGMIELKVDAAATNGQRFNIIGQPVGEDYNGFVIVNGKVVKK